MRRLRLAAALAMIIGLETPALLAQAPADGKWWKRPRVARQLDLSSDQVAQLEKIFAQSKPKLIDLRADFEKKQFDYDQAMQDDDVDRKNLETKIEARELARASLQKELALMELDMKKVLSPAQREKLVEMREAARALVKERRRRMRDSAIDGETDEAPAQRQKRVATPRPGR